MAIFDVTGNAFAIGDFVCFDGGGNKKNRYGFIVGKVLDINDENQKILIEYFRLDYTPIKFTKKKVWKEHHKLVKVLNPSTKIINIFRDDINKYDRMDKESIASWLHSGSYSNFL